MLEIEICFSLIISPNICLGDFCFIAFLRRYGSSNFALRNLELCCSISLISERPAVIIDVIWLDNTYSKTNPPKRKSVPKLELDVFKYIIDIFALSPICLHRRMEADLEAILNWRAANLTKRQIFVQIMAYVPLHIQLLSVLDALSTWLDKRENVNKSADWSRTKCTHVRPHTFTVLMNGMWNLFQMRTRLLDWPPMSWGHYHQLYSIYACWRKQIHVTYT